MEDKLLIASDIHGNLTCFKKLLRLGFYPEQTYILGDVLSNGKTDEENAILDLIKRSGLNFLLGNHEEEYLRKYQSSSKSRLRRERNQTSISSKNRRFLRNSPFILEYQNVLLTHTPIPPRRVKSIETATEAFSRVNNRLCFHGHYHHPNAYSYDPRTGLVTEVVGNVLNLEDNLKYMINPGSLGVNRTYLIYDPNNRSVKRETF